MLIATNKIADYVQKNPEAKPELLTWLKNYPYRPRPNVSRDPERPYGEAMANPGVGDHSVKTLINDAAGIELITWVGTPAEYDAMILQQYPGSIKRVKVVEKVVMPSPIMAYKTNEANRQVVKILPLNSEPIDQIPDGEPFQTTAAYEEALTKTETLIKSKPGTPEYEELIQLLPSIKAYEKQKLTFPKITAAEMIRERMRIFKIAPHELPLTARYDFNADAFFAGQLELPTDVLAHLYKSLSLLFPVTDRTYMV